MQSRTVGAEMSTTRMAASGMPSLAASAARDYSNEGAAACQQGSMTNHGWWYLQSETAVQDIRLGSHHGVKPVRINSIMPPRVTAQSLIGLHDATTYTQAHTCLGCCQVP